MRIFYLFGTLSAALLAMPLFLQYSTPQIPTGDVRPRKIILMIGDGMGLTQVSTGLYSNGNHLNLERCTVTGLITTHASDHLVTDSGAGATAFACGCKTYNGAIGVNAKRRPCQTILEYADSLGLATGLVSSCSTTHATPASFVAHVHKRQFTEEIATFFLKTMPDLMIGGGLKFFNQRTDDTRNLCTELEQAGCAVHTYKESALKELQPDPSKPFFWFSADEEPVKVSEGRDYLPLAAKMAPAFLKQRGGDKGFFLMLEGSQIDWAGHANDAPYLVAEMLDFDAAIGAVLDFAAADKETLVVITADHETGGAAIMQGSVLDSLDIAFTTKGHTASMVPVFAFGPGSEHFSGLYDNTDIYFRIRKAMGW